MVLDLPEHFGLVTDPSGLTVQLTPRGHWLQLYVVELDTAQLVVRDADGKSGTFGYLVHGVRRGAKQHEVIPGPGAKPADRCPAAGTGPKISTA